MNFLIRLGIAVLRLGEPKVLFLFSSSVNYRNHPLDLRRILISELKGPYMYTSYMKNVMNLAIEVKRRHTLFLAP